MITRNLSEESRSQFGTKSNTHPCWDFPRTLRCTRWRPETYPICVWSLSSLLFQFLILTEFELFYFFVGAENFVRAKKNKNIRLLWGFERLSNWIRDCVCVYIAQILFVIKLKFTMKIYVKELKGKEIQIDCDLSSKVIDIKLEIESQLSIPGEKQYFC